MGFLYFAYGSNLLLQRLLYKHRHRKPARKGIARLDSYELRFKGNFSTTWSGQVATVDQCPGASVWGVIWELDDADRPGLDRQEDMYCPITVRVSLVSGGTFECLTYQMDKGDVDIVGKPSPHYLDIIKRGAEQNGLPQTYIDCLHKIEHNQFDGVVETYCQLIQTLTEES